MAHTGVGIANLGGGWTEIVPTSRTRSPVTHPLDAFVGCLAAIVAAARGIDLTDESPTGRTDDSGRVFAGAAEARTCSLEPTVGAGLTAASLAYCATSVLARSVT